MLNLIIDGKKVHFDNEPKVDYEGIEAWCKGRYPNESFAYWRMIHILEIHFKNKNEFYTWWLTWI